MAKELAVLGIDEGIAAGEARVPAQVHQAGGAVGRSHRLALAANEGTASVMVTSPWAFALQVEPTAAEHACGLGQLGGGGPMGRHYALRTSRTGVVDGISDGPNVAGSARPNAQEAVAGWTADGCPLTSVIVQDSS
jgi:hypothetical protein